MRKEKGAGEIRSRDEKEHIEKGVSSQHTSYAARFFCKWGATTYAIAIKKMLSSA